MFYVGNYPGEANISTAATEICSITLALCEGKALYRPAKMFEFIVDRVRAKHQKILYYKGSNSMNADPKQ